MFDPAPEGDRWECPFCHPNSTVYQLSIPPSTEIEASRQIRSLIRQHVELHQKDILTQLKGTHPHYEKVKKK